MDYNHGTNDRLYVRYSRLYANDPTTNNFPLSDNQYTIDNAHNGVINWTHTIGSNIVNEARFGVNYVQSDRIVIAPVRFGVGWRQGLNVGYMHFSAKYRLNPF